MAYTVKQVSVIVALILPTACYSGPNGASGEVDLSFNADFFPGPPVATVRAVAVQPDHKVIVAGSGIARLNADGSQDTSFSRLNDPNRPVGNVFDIALQPDGKLLMAHDYGVSRLNADGSWDTAFITPSVLDDNLSGAGVRAVAVQSDGRILIAGPFRIINSNIRNSVARLHPDGSLDSSFVPETVDNFFSGAFCMALQSDGKVLIGGQALTWRNDCVARLNSDGTMDGQFFSVVADVFVWSIALQPDGKTLIGGPFGTINNSNRPEFARLNVDGSLDERFNPGAGIKAFASQADGKPLVGGDSMTIGGTVVKGMARLNANGTLDPTYSPELGPHPSISTITVQPDGKALISGPDVAANVPPDYNLLSRLNAGGARDRTFVAGKHRGGAASWMRAQDDGKVLIGGGFPFIDGTNYAALVRLNADGSLDSILNTTAGYDRPVLQPNGKWLLADASARFNADWTLDTSFSPPVVDNQIASVAVRSDDQALIGGNFATVNGTNRSGIARLKVDGSLDPTFVAEISASANSIYSLLVQPDGKILVGGEFSSVDQAHRYGLVRLDNDGHLDGSFNHIDATNGSAVDIRNILLQPDGKIIITGDFFYVHGVRRDYIARLNANGSLDSTFDAGSFNDLDLPFVRGASTVTLEPDGRMFVLGDYYLGHDEYIQGIFRLNANGTVDPGFNPSGGLPFDVRSVAVELDGNVLISGSFLAINGTAHPYLARLFGDTQTTYSLRIARSDASVILSWPTNALNFRLEENKDIPQSTAWSLVAQNVTTNGDQISVSISSTVGQMFFRLKSQ